MLTRKKIKTALLLTTIAYLLIAYALATPPAPPPLLEKLKALQCSTDKPAAKAALDTLWNAHNNDFLFPDEWMNDEEKNHHLYAASMDIALEVFVQTIDKYPTLQRQVERTFLQWNYCDVFRGGKFYDLTIINGALQKKEANYPSPLDWSGFRKLGFLAEKATYIPELLIHAPIGERAFENFFHRIYRSHCFPHPVTGEMFYVKQRIPPQRLIQPVETIENSHYPYVWNQECKTTTVVDVALPTVIVEDKEMAEPVIEPKTTSVEIVASVPKIEVLVTVEPETQVVQEIQTVEQTSPANLTIDVPIAPPPLLIDTLADEMHDTYQRNNAFAKQNVADRNSKEILDSLLLGEELYGHSDDDLDKGIAKGPKLNLSVFDIKPNSPPPPVPSSNIPASSTAALLPRMISENPNESSGFSGGVYLTHGLGSHSTSIGGALSWTPIKDSYWNIRVGGNYVLDATEDPFSYSWGFGYSDWHAGTVSYQLNNYGPIKPGEGLAIDKAVGNIGYSVKSKTLDKLKLGVSGSIDIPVEGDPALNAGVQWSPKENWFIRAGVNQPLNGNDPSWSYGFGYSNWRPNKINIAYSNYGPNELFDTNFNKNGSITISYNWEF